MGAFKTFVITLKCPNGGPTCPIVGPTMPVQLLPVTLLLLLLPLGHVWGTFGAL